MSRRRSVRRTRRLQVTFWRRGDPHGYPGFTTNISTTGMFVGTHNPFSQGTRLRIEVLDRERGFVVEGVVAHARRGSVDLGRLSPSGMGVRFLSVGDLVRELVPGVEGEEVYAAPTADHGASVDGKVASGELRGGAAGSGEPRGGAALDPEPRPDAAPAGVPVGGERVFSVRFAGAAQFLDIFRRDIANGGLFVSTPEPARLQEVVTIDLHPPAPRAQAIRCRARVVHRAEPPPAAGLGGPNLLAGMGVELLETQAVCERLRPLVEKLGQA